MLTFIAISTILNLALGYGLALYLGPLDIKLPKMSLPWSRSAKAVDSSCSEPMTIPVEELVPTPPLAATAADPPPSLAISEPATELPELVSPLLSANPAKTIEAEPALPNQEPASEQEQEQSESPAPIVSEDPQSISESLPQEEPNVSSSQAPTEEDLVAGIAAFRAQLSASTNSESLNENQTERVQETTANQQVL